MKPRIAIVVPWRPGDPQRERAWEWCREWWKQFGWPIIPVEHAGPEPFNRSWCINEGARRAWPWDLLIAIDADVFEEDPQQIHDGVASAITSGRLTIPHTVGVDLAQTGTRALIDGRGGWERSIVKRREVCTSRVWIMREDLFSDVGGFDERFQGWGYEDVAAFHSMRTLRGVTQELDAGTCYHLYHRPSLIAARKTAEWQAGQKLAQRYLEADRQGWPALKPILDERTSNERWNRPMYQTPLEPMKREPRHVGTVDVMVLTAGRKSYLERTLASFAEKVTGDIGHKLIQDDSGDPEFGRWLRSSYPGWEIVTTPGKQGFTRAIRSAWMYELARTIAAPYLFHLEEDFVFDRDVDLGDLVKILEQDAKLAQVALLRGPFFPPEIRAGGIIQEDPEAYVQQGRNGTRWLEHRKFFTTNPCLYRRDLMRLRWPNMKHSETVFTRNLTRRGYKFAFIGEGEPWVSHIGVERTGLGY